MATPSSTRYFMSSFAAAPVVVAMIFYSSLRLESENIQNSLARISCCNSAGKHRLRVRTGRQNTVEKQADNRGGEFPGIRIHAGLMPFVSPVHHPKEAENRNAGVDTGGQTLTGKGVEDLTRQVVIAAFDGLNLLAIGLH